MFDLNNGTVNQPPNANSLFNIDTLKALYDAGSMAVDVIENPSVDVATFDENITVFNDVTQRLGVLDNRYSYILFLWMKNLKIYTFER